ncbi:MAG: hypothetical protein IJS69_04915 [Selenomonadaceae bacterium]|nr:hypothetical protein [Selenomonadaceae bacterium]
MKSSVNIIATDPNGKKIQKAITDINPNASTAQLRDFVENLNGLTNNTLGTPVRIDRTELVDESQLLDRNMMLNNLGTRTKSIEFTYEATAVYSATVEFNGNISDITADMMEVDNPTGLAVSFTIEKYSQSGNPVMAVLAIAPDASTIIERPSIYGTITFKLKAGGGYKSDAVTFVIKE